MRIVVALGGNALLRRGEKLTDETQRNNVQRAVASLAPLLTGKNEVVITHGNGPQVGLLALQSAAGPEEARHPLDVLGAESEGMLGYLIERELFNALPADRLFATLLTQVLVDPSDPAFGKPSKPIGPVYAEDEARKLASQRGWSLMRDGAHWRRAVASPKPQAIMELAVISLLASRGVIVICAGGGGIPVARGGDGRIRGVEAVIDKDLASSLLAREIGAERLLLLTDVEGVYLGWPAGSKRLISEAGPDAIDPEAFEPGSMRPKVEAAVEFARLSGKPATIGRLCDAAALLDRRAGTTIDPLHRGMRLRE